MQDLNNKSSVRNAKEEARNKAKAFSILLEDEKVEINDDAGAA